MKVLASGLRVSSSRYIGGSWGGGSYNTKNGMNTSGVRTTDSSQSQDSFPDSAVSAAASEDGFLPWIAKGAKCCERRKTSLGLLGGSGGSVSSQSLYSISRCYKYQNPNNCLL